MTFRIHNQHSYDVISIVSNDFLGIVEEFDNDNYTISNFRGFAITHRAVLTEETPKGNHTVRELSESPGEWAAMAHSNQSDGVEYLYFTDRFGYSPIFYSTQSQSHIVISSTFSGVVAGLRHLGEDCTLNVVNYSATIASNVPFFQNSFSHETMANEIFILPAKYALKITKIGWALVDRESLDGTAQITEYADALLRGVEQTKAVVDTIVASNALNRRITLTGGVDSRLCAALLSKSGKLQNFRVSTIDSRKWEGRPGQRGINRDIVISNEIRKKFGLEWWSLPERIKKPWEFIESLAAFQSYRSNFAYTFVPSAGHVRFAKPVISIRGGGGEILRVDATMEKIATEFETAAAQQASGCLDEGLWYANHVMRGSLLSGSLRSEAIERIAANFPRNYGNSFLERISKLYLDHRYRGHFGHQRQTTSANDIILHPLSNTYFLKSSALADFDSLKSGRLVLDIFEAADPVFLEQTFASDDWSRLLTGRIGDESEYTSTEWIADFDASHVPSTITMDRSIKPDRQVAAPAQSLLETSLQYLSVAFEEINSRVPSVNIEEIKDLHKKIISRVKIPNIFQVTLWPKRHLL